MNHSVDALNGLTIVVAAFNEINAIEQTLLTAKRVLNNLKYDYEIIVVDDGSTDATAEIAANCGVKVIRHPSNGGYGRSLLTGIEHAVYESIVIIDADGTYSIEELPDLLEVYKRGFHMVVGARQGPHYHGSVNKQILRLIFRILVEYTCGRSIPDINSGFRIFHRSPVLAIRSSLSPGFSFTTTITLLFMLNNLFVAYVPISYRGRIGKSKVRLVSDGLRSLQIIVTAIAQFNPLKLFLLLILANLSGSILLIVLSLIMPTIMNRLLWLMLILGWETFCIIVASAIVALVFFKPGNTHQHVK